MVPNGADGGPRSYVFLSTPTHCVRFIRFLIDDYRIVSPRVRTRSLLAMVPQLSGAHDAHAPPERRTQTNVQHTEKKQTTLKELFLPPRAARAVDFSSQKIDCFFQPGVTLLLLRSAPARWRSAELRFSKHSYALCAFHPLLYRRLLKVAGHVREVAPC